MKRCTKCFQEKDLKEFRIIKRLNKPSSICKSCHYQLNVDWRKRHPEKLLEYRNRYYQKHTEKLIAKTKEWQGRNKEKVAQIKKDSLKRHLDTRYEWLRKRKRAERDLVYRHYGGYQCARCPENDPDVLTIDHIHDNGAAHRKELKNHGGSTMCTWLIKNGFPPGYQILCRNCNWRKYIRSKSSEGSETIPEGSTVKRPEARSPSSKG
jgi:hypothetical protein